MTRWPPHRHLKVAAADRGEPFSFCEAVLRWHLPLVDAAGCRWDRLAVDGGWATGDGPAATAIPPPSSPACVDMFHSTPARGGTRQPKYRCPGPAAGFDGARFCWRPQPTARAPVSLGRPRDLGSGGKRREHVPRPPAPPRPALQLNYFGVGAASHSHRLRRGKGLAAPGTVEAGCRSRLLPAGAGAGPPVRPTTLRARCNAPRRAGSC